MTFTSLLSLEQIIAMKEPFAAVEITDADFNRIENIGDLIRHIEILDERRQIRRSWRLALKALSLDRGGCSLLRREIVVGNA